MQIKRTYLMSIFYSLKSYFPLYSQGLNFWGGGAWVIKTSDGGYEGLQKKSHHQGNYWEIRLQLWQHGDFDLLTGWLLNHPIPFPALHPPIPTPKICGDEAYNIMRTPGVFTFKTSVFYSSYNCGLSKLQNFKNFNNF